MIIISSPSRPTLNSLHFLLLSIYLQELQSIKNRRSPDSSSWITTHERTLSAHEKCLYLFFSSTDFFQSIDTRKILIFCFMKLKFFSFSTFQLIKIRHFSHDASKEDLKRFYISEIDLFESTLIVSEETLSDNVIRFYKFRVFRCVRFFIQQIKCVRTKNDISLVWVIDFCIQNNVFQWFNSLTFKKSLRMNSLKPFYETLMKQFDENTRIEKTRIVKEKAEVFVYRRCFVKYPSNIKLHKHVCTKHVKPTKPTSIENSPSAFNTVTLVTSPVLPSLALLTSTLSSTSVALSIAAITTHITTSFTSKIPILWTEIASKSKSNTPSRLSRIIAKYDFFTSSPSSILLHQKPVNHITRPTSTTPTKLYLTVQDLYIRFHGKPRPSSLAVIQNRSSSASPSGLRQARITAYFKRPASHSPASPAPMPKAPLASNRQHDNSKRHGQTTGFSDLAPKIQPGYATRRTCRRCKQQFTSGNMLHRHLRHCIAGTQRWPSAAYLMRERHLSQYY